MVDLGFLLITFFIITTTWSESKTMKFYLPAGDNKTMRVVESTALTIIPLKNDQLFYYHGDLEVAVQHSAFGITGYSLNEGIGEIIRSKMQSLNRQGKFKSEDMMLIIKPTEEATYKNLVDAMDEVLINDVKHYVLTEIDKSELEVLTTLALH